MNEQNLIDKEHAVEPVRHAVTVPLAVAAAFSLFTTEFDSWWPRHHHIGAAELREAIIEPVAGGRWYERGVDGSECDWGQVLAYEPPGRLLLRWQINGKWEYDADPARGSEVEITFTPAGPGQTRVQLEHRLFGRHGSAGQAIRDAVGSDGGWSGIMRLYADRAAA
jgi:uncharacterized protein YndB with AHSA1/START domain